MSNAVKVAPALKSRSSIPSRVTDEMVFLPLHGGGNASAINLSATAPITRGVTTKLALGSVPSIIPMVGTQIKLNSVTPSAYDGYHKVIDASGANVWIDLDSSGLADWESGGNVTFNVIYDQMGRMASQDVQGVLTNLWANQTLGITADAAGTFTNRITDGIEAFDLTGFRGYLVIGANVQIAALPIATEFIFSLGVSDASGTNTSSGAICMAIDATGNVQFTTRPAYSGAGVNTFIFSGALSAGVQANIIAILDCTNIPSSATIHIFKDGVLRESKAITTTGATDCPSNAAGVAIGCKISTSLTLQSKLGSSGSGAKVDKLLWWKSTKDFAATIEAARRYAVNGELDELMV